jgi:hypothetical protein
MHKPKGKDMFTEEKRKAQTKRTLEALKEEPATSMMLSVKLNIIRANLTRYLAKFESQGKVTVFKEDACEITDHRAKYYSANPIHFKPQVQSELFETEDFQI